MKWARFRFQNVTGPQRWQWEYFPDSYSKGDIDSYYKEKCSEEAVMYERGARIEWEIGEKPPKSILMAKSKGLKDRIKSMRKKATEIDSMIKSGRGLMTETQLEKLNKGARP